MFKRLLLAFCFLAIASCSESSSDDHLSSAVYIAGSDSDGKHFVGSGTYLGNGYVLTAKHVAAHAVLIGQFHDNEKMLYRLTVAWKSDDMDVAILKVEGGTPTATAAHVSCEPRVNREHMTVIGNPMGIRWVTTFGTVAAFLTDGKILLNATVLPGNSGGGVYDDAGNLVGVPDTVLLARAGGDPTNLSTFVPTSAFCKAIPEGII